MLENLRNSVGIRCWEIRPLEGNWVNGEGLIKTEFSWLITCSSENRASEEKRFFLYRPSAIGILLLIGHYNKSECTWWEDIESCKYLLCCNPSATLVLMECNLFSCTTKSDWKINAWSLLLVLYGEGTWVCIIKYLAGNWDFNRDLHLKVPKELSLRAPLKL